MEYKPFMLNQGGLLESQLSKGFEGMGGGMFAHYQPQQVQMPQWYGPGAGSSLEELMSLYGGIGNAGGLAALAGRAPVNPQQPRGDDDVAPDGYDERVANYILARR